MNVIEFLGIVKSYPLYNSASDRLLELLTLHRVQHHQEFLALEGISFQVTRGEAFCVVGQNGSGKSTLLQLLAGIMQPTRGTREVRGRVAALIELGAGFDPEFTGRQNVALSAAILGFSGSDIERRYRDIQEFAEIGDFIDQPVKTYSSGMLLRLAFAIAIHVNPDILLIDEALAVGDVYFRNRCLRRIRDLRARGVTIVFVSHSMGDVKAVGDRVLWLDRGRVREIGDPDLVLSKYITSVDGVPADGAGAGLELRSHTRHGSGLAKIDSLQVLDLAGREIRLLQPSTSIVIRIRFTANAPLSRPRVGVLIRNHVGLDFALADTDTSLAAVAANESRTVEFEIDLPHIYPAHFSFSPFVADAGRNSDTMCDWIDNAVTLEAVRTEDPVYGYVHIPARVEVNRRLSAYEHRVHG